MMHALRANTLVPIWNNSTDGTWEMIPGPTALMTCADTATLRRDLDGRVRVQDGDPIVDTEVSGPAIVRNATDALLARWREG